VEKDLTGKKLITKFIKRGLWIFSLGIVITIITWFFVGKGFVVFGVLHCIGISIILAYPFLKLRFSNLIIGIILVVFGITLKILTFNFYWFIWLGFKTPSFYTIDYFPLLPWFGVVLIGIFIGKSFYPEYKRVFELKDLSGLKPVSFLCHLGKHSLVIYFLHQVVILSIIYLYLQF
jgi:uncharacterized membrane protein